MANGGGLDRPRHDRALDHLAESVDGRRFTKISGLGIVPAGSDQSIAGAGLDELPVQVAPLHQDFTGARGDRDLSIREVVLVRDGSNDSDFRQREDLPLDTGANVVFESQRFAVGEESEVSAPRGVVTVAFTRVADRIMDRYEVAVLMGEDRLPFQEAVSQRAAALQATVAIVFELFAHPVRKTPGGDVSSGIVFEGSRLPLAIHPFAPQDDPAEGIVDELVVGASGTPNGRHASVTAPLDGDDALALDPSFGGRGDVEGNEVAIGVIGPREHTPAPQEGGRNEKVPDGVEAPFVRDGPFRGQPVSVDAVMRKPLRGTERARDAAHRRGSIGRGGGLAFTVGGGFRPSESVVGALLDEPHAVLDASDGAQEGVVDVEASRLVDDRDDVARRQGDADEIVALVGVGRRHAAR